MSTTLADIQIISTVCSFCGTGCGIEITVHHGEIVKVAGDKKSPVSHGETCVKGSQAWAYIQSQDRLTHPLIRRNGELQKASWNEALDLIQSAASRYKTEFGGDAFGCFSSSRSTNELNFVAQKFMRQVLGSNNIDSCNRT